MDAPVKSLAALSEKTKALQAALAQIEKQFGKGTIMRLGEGEVIEDIQVVSTGSLGLDIALGVGGLPRGRVIEIYGPESSGKTTLTLQVIAEMQKQNGTCAFVDAEHALDIQYAQKLGVNLQELLISQPDTGEQALEIVDSLVRSGAVDLIVIDSVAALTPKAELEGDMGDSLPGLQATAVPAVEQESRPARSLEQAAEPASSLCPLPYIQTATPHTKTPPPHTTQNLSTHLRASEHEHFNPPLPLDVPQIARPAVSLAPGILTR